MMVTMQFDSATEAQQYYRQMYDEKKIDLHAYGAVLRGLSGALYWEML